MHLKIVLFIFLLSILHSVSIVDKYISKYESIMYIMVPISKFLKYFVFSFSVKNHTLNFKMHYIIVNIPICIVSVCTSKDKTIKQIR